MPRLTLDDFRGLPDILTSDAYLLEFGTVPLEGSGEANSRELTLAVQNVPMPGVSNEAFEVSAHGHTVKQRGRLIFAREFATTTLLPMSMKAFRTLHAWHQFVVNIKSGNSSGNKDDYTVDSVKITLFKPDGDDAHFATMFGVFPQTVDDVALDGTASTPLTIGATFSYDYVEHDQVAAV